MLNAIGGMCRPFGGKLLRPSSKKIRGSFLTGLAKSGAFFILPLSQDAKLWIDAIPAYSLRMNGKRDRPAVLLLLFFYCSICAAQQTAIPSVTIVLTDQTGAAVPRTDVRIVPAPDPAPKMETDENGKLVVHLKSGGYAFFASVSGFRPLATHFDVRADLAEQSIPFVLQIAPNGSPVVIEAAARADLQLFASPYHDPSGITLAQLKALPHIKLNVHDIHANADEEYSGVRVAEILAPLGAPLGKEMRGIALATYLVAKGSDGYGAVLALAEVDPAFHSGEVIVADGMNGKPLDAHSGPLKLVVSEDKRPARWVRNLTVLELRAVQ